MNELKIFENAEFGSIRTLEINNEPYFVGKDVAEVLGYERPTKAIQDRVDIEDKDEVPIQDSIGRMQKTPIINESGLYSLILSSKLPTAKKFKRWVTSEVLPSIRKHGAYMTPETLEEAILNPDYLIKIATALKEEKDKNMALQIQNANLTVDNQIMKPKSDYFDELVERNLLTGIRETAKQLCIKQKCFVNFLLEHKYMYRDKKGRLMPYAKHIDSGLFELKECYDEKTSWKGTQSLITPKGRETFRLLCINNENTSLHKAITHNSKQ